LPDIIAKLSGGRETRLCKDMTAQETEVEVMNNTLIDGCDTRHDSERRHSTLHLLASLPRMNSRSGDFMKNRIR
jgi:hypothetical protein